MEIVVTGEGIVSAIGNSTAEVLDSLLSRKSGIGEMRYLRSVHKELPVGEVKMSNDEMKRELGIDTAEDASRTTLMGIMAVNQIAKDLPAGADGSEPRPRIVLVSGTTVGTMDVTERHFGNIRNEDNASLFRYHGCGGCTKRIADYFGIFADCATVSTACSSAANAILLGANLIKAGKADIVVAGGSEALSRFHLNGFNSLMILDKEQCRPFDADRTGLNLGEGAAFVVLESEEYAKKRGAAIHAYLTGYGNACDAFHQTASSENGEGAYLAMKEALKMAGLAPEKIDYVNAHGTGTPNNDASEGVALKRIFGDKMPKVSSTKSFTGHTTSASGSIESVICLIAMQNGFIPANLGWHSKMPGGIVPTLGEDHAELHNVLCNSFGFGGNDTSLVFSKSPKTQAAEDYMDNYDPNAEIKVLAKVEITDEDSLKEIRNYVKPLEARRMGRLMKASLLSSFKALQASGIDKPDAVITGTAYGCIDNTERILDQMEDEGEQNVSPTYFMQSTHNTIGSNVAIRLHCHGYNSTYSQRGESLSWAVTDAELLLRSGKCRTVLVGCHDESSELLNMMLSRYGQRANNLPVNSVSLVLSCGK